MTRQKRWVVRTVRNGKVDIYGRTYEPRADPAELPYDGRLEGMRCVFATYPDWGGQWENTVYFFGPEATDKAMRAAPDEATAKAAYLAAPNQINGKACWRIWDALPTLQTRRRRRSTPRVTVHTVTLEPDLPVEVVLEP